MQPIVEITIDGRPVAGAFYERLVSLTVTDKAGIGADTFDMELLDGPPSFLALPRTGAIVDIRLGYAEQGVRSLGSFTVDKVSAKCLPYSLSIGGKSADLKSGKLKEHQERHWDNATLAEIVGEIAGEAGLEAVVDPVIGAYVYPWIAQQDETDIHFLRRLERRHNGLFSIKGGRLVLAQRGGGSAASGAFVGTVVVTPDRVIRDTLSFEASDRTRYSKVVAYYQDRDQAERIEIEADGDAEGDSVYRIPDPFASVAEADEAAQAKARDLKRGTGSTSVQLVGDTAITAGAPLLYRGIRPGLDGVPYVIDTVAHTLTKPDGYRSRVDAKLYDGASGDDAGSDGDRSGGGGGPNGPSGTSAADVPAPDAPAGTPATPSKWHLQRRYGRTDDN